MILTKYLVLGLPATCSVNGISGMSAEVFSDLSSYTAGQRKTFSVPVTYSCPLDQGLVDDAFQLRLVVDHGGDDFPNPDNDDSVPANNVRIISKFIK
jgi:hypothetical protein